MDQGSLLDHFAQVRRQVVTLCSANRFSAAQMLLVGSGLSVTDAPGLWEHIARRAAQAGHDPIAHEVRKLIWQAGGRNEALTLQEAAFFLKQKDYTNCAFVIEAQFGTVPEHPEALEYLTRAYMLKAQAQNSAGRLRTDRDIALRLTDGLTPHTASHAMAAIDLLRFSGAFDRAIDLNTAALVQFPEDVRFVMRQARMAEQKGQYDAAAAYWRDVVQSSERYKEEALFRLYSLQDRLEQHEEAQTTAAQLLTKAIPIDMRLRLALVLGQQYLVQSIARLIAAGGPTGHPITYEQGKAIGDALLDHGEIGLLVWLRRMRMPLSDATKSILDRCTFGAAEGPKMPDSFEEAASIQSPDFMLPLDQFATRTPKPPGWPGQQTSPGRVLLVNASLKAGGAERQFVALAKALCDAGLPTSDLHVALFSLEADRDMDRFLPDLKALGVTIHNLDQRVVHNPTLPSDVSRLLNALPYDMRQDLRPLWHLVTELRPNVLHGWQDRSAVACGLAGFLAETERIVLSMRNMAPHTRQDRKLQRNHALLASLAARDNVVLTANSDNGVQDYQDWLGLPAGRVRPLRNIVDVARFDAIRRNRPARPDTSPLVIGGVFRMALNKRPLLWLRTIAALKEQTTFDIRPRLFGDGPMQDRVLAEAKQLGLDNLELITSESLPEHIYSDMDALLLMSRVEGLPNVLLEAQATGLPIAACDVGGVREAAQKRGDAQALLLDADITPDIAAAQIADWLPVALAAKADPRIGFVRTHFGAEITSKSVLDMYCGTESLDHG